MGRLQPCLALVLGASIKLAACGATSTTPTLSTASTSTAATSGAAVLSPAGSTADASAVPVEVVEPDPASAPAALTVIGATPSEAEATHAAVAILGGALDVQEVSFTGRGSNRAVTTAVPEDRSTDVASRERFWLADLLGTEIARRTRGTAQPVRMVEIKGEGGWRVQIEPQQPRDVATIADALAQRATAAGLDATVRAWRFTRPAVELRVRLDDRALLEGDLGWLEGLLADDRRDPAHGYDQLVTVEAPGGIVVAALGTTSSAGFAGYGPDTSDPMPPPVGVDGPTTLTITATFADSISKRERVERLINCANATDAALCADLIARRAALFAPLIPHTTCSDGVFADDVKATGSVLGVPVERQYDACYGGVTAAWRDLLAAQPVGP